MPHLMLTVCFCRPLSEAASSCELSPLSTLTASEGNTLTLGRFDRVGTAAMAAAAASNAIEIADGEGSRPFVARFRTPSGVPLLCRR